MGLVFKSTRTATLTPSWTGADLESLTRLALSNALTQVMGGTLGKFCKHERYNLIKKKVI